MTDHRIGRTLYNLPHMLEREIDEIIAAQQQVDYEGKLAALTGRRGSPLPGAGDD